MKPEIVFDMPDLDYRKVKAASISGLKVIEANSPAHYKASLTAPRKVTPAMVFGVCLHHLLLTPDAKPRFVAVPKEFLTDGGAISNAKAAREWKEAQANAGFDVIRPDEIEQANRMVEAIRRHPAGNVMFRNGKPEVSVFGEFSLPCGYSVDIKGRLDWLDDADAICDLKTCASALPDDISSASDEHGWGIQAELYLQLYNRAAELAGLPPKSCFYWLAVEKEPPFDMVVYEYTAGHRTFYADRLHLILTKYASCKKADRWPGYSPRIQPLPTHKWGNIRRANKSLSIDQPVTV